MNAPKMRKNISFLLYITDFFADLGPLMLSGP
jgi:hypothetical protein